MDLPPDRQALPPSEAILPPEASGRILRSTLLLFSIGILGLWLALIREGVVNPFRRPGMALAITIVSLGWTLAGRHPRSTWLLLIWGYGLGSCTIPGMQLGYGTLAVAYFVIPPLVMLSAWVLSPRQAVGLTVLVSLVLLAVGYREGLGLLNPAPPMKPLPRAFAMICLFGVGLLATLKILQEYRKNLEQRDWATEQMAQLNRELEATVARRTAEAVEGRARLQAIIESTSDFIWSVAVPDFRLVTFNQAYQDYCSRSLHRRLEPGMDMKEMLSPALVEQWRGYLRRALDEGPFEMEYQLSAEARVLHLAFNHVRQGEAVVGLSMFGKDITERKRNEALLMEAQKAAEAATRAKSAFLANMSHEIRTPMNAVIGMTHLALQTELTEQQRNYLVKTKAAADGLLGLINDILDFSKIEAGRLQMEARPFLLAEVCEQVLQLVGQKAAEKGLDFKLERAPDVPASLVGDPLRLGQVLTNLCSNAVKFTEGGGLITVAFRRLATVDERVTLEIEVRDPGIGMTEEQTRTLFQPFTQVDSSSTRRFAGTGLGLAISRHLVELMGGGIRVESERGLGSAFIFTATFGLGHLQPAPRPQADGLAGLQVLQGAQVLLVEDNAFNQEVAAELLGMMGVVVTVAGDGAQALEKARGRAFDAVLMDLQMPVMDGYEAALQLRADPAFDALPILAMTAHAMVQERQRCAAIGMDDYITKPIDPRDLGSKLAKWIRGRSPG